MSMKNENHLEEDKTEVEITDFDIRAMIGEGGFGKVYMVQKRDTNRLYAMKQLRKIDLLQHKQIESTLIEKKILEGLNNPFLVSTEYVITTEHKVFFIMELCRGGELYNLLQRSPKSCFSENRARFYIAQIALGLGYLHK